MKVRGFKSLKNIFIGVFIILFIFIASTLLVIYICKDNQKTNPTDAATVSWTGSGTQSDPYIINSGKKLRALAVNVSEGEDYEGVYFELGASINYQRDNDDVRWFPGIGVQGYYEDYYDYYLQQPFNGYFDGNGYSVYNFEINTKYESTLYWDADPAAVGLGFFACLGPKATVSNLRLSDFTLYVNYHQVVSSYDVVFIGGIAGACMSTSSNASKISNCSVENMSVKCETLKDNPDIWMGGLLGGANIYGSSKINISNCYVKDVSVDSALYISPMQNSGDDIVGAFIGDVQGSYAQISNCILAGTYPSYFDDYANGNWSSGASVNSSATNVYLTKPSSWKLGSIGNAGGSSGTTWYYHSDYNNDYPYLRSFMSWKKVTINVNDDSLGSVSPTTFQIPSDVSKTYSSTSSTISIFGQKVTATSKSGAAFDSWTCTNATTYTANFKLSTYTITFKACTNSNRTREASYTINPNTQVTVTKTSLSKPNCYSQVKFSFKDSNGTSRTVTYTPNTNHYLTCTEYTHNVTYDEPFYVSASPKTYSTFFT